MSASRTLADIRGHFLSPSAFNVPAQSANFLCNRFASSRVYISVTD